MSFCRLFCILLAIGGTVLPGARAAEIGPFTGPDADAEAARLYDRANDYVKNVMEGQYSYAYIQFHWKRAGSNIDRILRAYPSSPTAAQLHGDALMVGPFHRDYFKERVLPRLEEKKVGSFDAINCAIFLYYLEGNIDEPARKELLAQIITTLCRQKRWSEALGFPIADEERAWLWRLVASLAVYKNEMVVEELLLNTSAEDLPEMVATIAESRAFRGDSIEELQDFLSEHPNQPGLPAAVFAGLVRREVPIQRARQLKRELKGIFDGVDPIENPDRSVDLLAFLQTIPTGSARQTANRSYARYLAAIGQLEKGRQLAASDDQLALAMGYAGHLIAHEKYQAALALPDQLTLASDELFKYQLHLAQLFAQAGRDTEVALVRAEIPPAQANDAIFREWRGRILSTQNQLVIREHLFANLPFADPNLTGRLICEWSLTPNRTLRGAAPWDAVVFKFAPGYANLPPPKDQSKVEAAGR